MNTNDPTPAASRPGTSITPSSGPPKPATSIRRNAPTRGEPRRVLMAAKLPAAPMTTVACAGASFLTRCTMSTASPPPIAMRGASGPRTAPRQRVRSAAMTMPGNISVVGAGLDLKPSAGECPPVPGRNWMVAATAAPAITRMGRGHHAGALVEAEVDRQGGEHPLLGHVHELQEVVRDQRDRYADDRAEQQQHDVLPAPEQLLGAGRGRRRRGCGRLVGVVGHACSLTYAARTSREDQDALAGGSG